MKFYFSGPAAEVLDRPWTPESPEVIERFLASPEYAALCARPG